MSLALLMVREVALEAKTVRLGVRTMGGATGILIIAAEKANKISKSVKMTKQAKKLKIGTASMNSCI